MILLGAIADDYTGATDLAGMLSAQGVRTVQVLGVRSLALAPHVQAVVIALKSRAEPVARACQESLAALRELQRLGARQIYFKYCSTFDSTRAGNIGPVTDALMTALGTKFTVAVPALPVNGRTQYLGHLFVNGEPLSESPMRNHPLNPMTDSNLVRHLQAQTHRKVGLVPLPMVRRRDVASECKRLEATGVEIALIDAAGDEDLAAIAEACVDMPLLTGGSGLGMKLPAFWKVDRSVGAARPVPGGGVLMLAGSCSARTLEQIRAFAGPKVALDVRALPKIPEVAPGSLVYSSMRPAERQALLAEAGDPEKLRRSIEQALAAIASRAVRQGVRQIVVAGGETSGAVVEALAVTALEIGEQIAPGVPHCRTIGEPPLDLVLKSGNFGDADFFAMAQSFLEGE